jgi:hypothetical protein
MFAGRALNVMETGIDHGATDGPPCRPKLASRVSRKPESCRGQACFLSAADPPVFFGSQDGRHWLRRGASNPSDRRGLALGWQAMPYNSGWLQILLELGQQAMRNWGPRSQHARLGTP